MALKLSVLRGPLPDRGLDDIAATYGTVDPRYASRDFLRTVFNENPFGYSYHAFVRDGDRVVGHHAVIPIRVRARGDKVASGKGEALYLDPSCRSLTVETPSGNVLAGMALMRASEDHALADGVRFVHGITSPAIGVIQRIIGSKAVKLSLDQLHFLTRDPSTGRLVSRAQLQRPAALIQRTLLAAARVGARLTGAPSVERNTPAHADFHLAALAATEPRGPAWEISRDLETLKWMQRLGRLDVVSVVGRPEHFAVMTRGDSRELLLWRVPPDERRSGLAIVCGLLTASIADRARVLSVSRRLAAEAGPSLTFALRLLGFFPQRIPITIYIKSRDDYFLQSANLEFNRLINL
jgi:hypothetical protein